MGNERERAADIRIGSHKNEKKKYQVITIIFLLAGLISISLYLLYRAPIGEEIGPVVSPQTYETFKSDLKPMKTSLNIVGIGDSLTKGVGDLSEKGYAGMTVEVLKKSDSTSNVSFEDYGIKGDTTSDLIKVLKREDVQKSIKNADMIFMTIGGNDVVKVLKENFLHLNFEDFKRERLTYQRNFNGILQNIYHLNPKVTVYYMGLYNPFEDLFPDLDSQFQDILQQWNLGSETILSLYPHTEFVPTADLFQNKTSELLYNDHFHPNKKGYQLISSRLVSAIQEKK